MHFRPAVALLSLSMLAIGGGGEHRARWILNLTRLRLVRIAP
jgi:hypothetical protein